MATTSLITQEELANKFLEHSYNDLDFNWGRFRTQVLKDEGWAEGLYFRLLSATEPDPYLIDFSYLKRYMEENKS